jgi:hypothetical protein
MSLAFGADSPQIQGRVNRMKQRLLAERLEQIIHRAVLKSLRTRRFISVRRDEDDRDFAMTGRQPAPQFDPAHSRHAHIEYQAARISEMVRFQNSTAEANTSTANPQDLIKHRSDSLTEVSSSTTEIRERLDILTFHL